MADFSEGSSDIPPSPARPGVSPGDIWSNFYQFQQGVWDFNQGLKTFEGDVHQIQAEIREEMSILRAAIEPLLNITPSRTVPVINRQKKLTQAHQAAINQFWQEGGRLWYWITHGLIFTVTFLGGNALLHPFEPQLQAWLHHHWGL